MHGHLLGGAMAQQRLFAIIINAVYISISMMNNIVFEFPDKRIASQRI